MNILYINDNFCKHFIRIRKNSFKKENKIINTKNVESNHTKKWANYYTSWMLYSYSNVHYNTVQHIYLTGGVKNGHFYYIRT